MNDFTIPEPKFRIYNTEDRAKQAFHPQKKGHVTLYSCGPTVYHYAHIGNFRTYVFEDLLRRTLKMLGMQVTQVTNITDIDDKTIRGAIAQNCSLTEYTKPYITAFFVDIGQLGIERSEYYPQATAYVRHMIDFIEKLMAKDFAYQSEDQSIYFSIERSEQYGRLSRLKLDELKEGAGDRRSALDEYEKDNVGDFVLWKAYEPERDGKVFWESPFGRGRPGWHLECSTMAMEILGNTIDLHVGAVDNIFPHHENEIAQSEACSGKQFVRFWMHAEHLIVDGKKMSKSLGNFYTLRDLLHKGYTGKEVRYILMHTHYRTQFNFTFETCKASQISLRRINAFIQRMLEKKEDGSKPTAECHAILQEDLNSFCEALADDLNISEALAALFELMRKVNTLDDAGKLSGGDAHETLFILQEMDRILNVMDFEPQEGVPPELQQMLEQREAARKNKEWQLSDSLRDQILERGYLIEDTPEGARLKKAAMK